MLSCLSVLEAVKGAVAERFEGEAYYLNAVPKDFKRPSFLVEIAKMDMSDASRAALAVTLAIRVTAFVEVDVYYNSQVEELARRLASLQELFCGCALAVEDRRLHFSEARGTIPGLDYAECVITTTYQDDRPSSAEDQPLMRSVTTNLRAG